MSTPEGAIPSQPAQAVAAGFAGSTAVALAEPIGLSADQDQPAMAPVRVDERISALDTIRGFALLGILLMNIASFGLPESAYFIPKPAAGGASGWNLGIWIFTFVLGEGKMRAIFSLCFGASVYLLIDRLSRKGLAADAADVHYRRMMWLMLFGMMHSYLIWAGDILFPYALCGLVLYPLRKLTPRVLLITSAVLLLALSGFAVADYFHTVRLHSDYNQLIADQNAGKKLAQEQEATKKEWEDMQKDFDPSAAELKKETDDHRGGYAKLFGRRAKDVYRFVSHPLYEPWPWYDFYIMMLVGIAFIKSGVLTGGFSNRFYVWLAAVSFAIGLSSNIWIACFVIKQDFSIESVSLTFAAYETGRFTAFGYIAVMMLILRAGWFRPVTRALANVGQMAFSNYLLTSIICTTIFEGYGFGLFGKLQRYQLYYVVLAVWAFNFALSAIWLRHFRFGPLEWVWRSLTYWKKQPMRIEERAA